MIDEQINHPPHYTNGNIEVMDYIIDSLSDEELRGYIKGNIIKYISRERHKGGDNDLRKMEWYLPRYIEYLRVKEEDQSERQEKKQVPDDTTIPQRVLKNIRVFLGYPRNVG